MLRAASGAGLGLGAAAACGLAPGAAVAAGRRAAGAECAGVGLLRGAGWRPPEPPGPATVHTTPARPFAQEEGEGVGEDAAAAPRAPNSSTQTVTATTAARRRWPAVR